jgi:hypothetical protein
MRKSTRALLGMVVLDLLLAFGALWLVMQVKSGATTTSVPPEEAISTITTTIGTAIGIISGVLLVVWFYWRRQEG